MARDEYEKKWTSAWIVNSKYSLFVQRKTNLTTTFDSNRLLFKIIISPTFSHYFYSYYLMCNVVDRIVQELDNKNNWLRSMEELQSCPVLMSVLKASDSALTALYNIFIVFISKKWDLMDLYGTCKLIWLLLFLVPIGFLSTFPHHSSVIITDRNGWQSYKVVINQNCPFPKNKNHLISWVPNV